MKWTRERILKEIRDRRARGQSLASGIMQQEAAGLLKASERILGSWRAALKAAGAPPPRGRGRPLQWTRERILEEIRARQERGCSLATRVVRREGSGLLKASWRIFGSWARAVQASDLPWEPQKRGRPFEWTRERILERIRKEARAQSGTKRIRLLRRTGGIYEAAQRVFGDWHEALVAAGVVMPRGERAYRPPSGVAVRSVDPVVKEGREVRLPCRRCGAMGIVFAVKVGSWERSCPRCGEPTRVEARLSGDRWVIHTK